MVFRLSISLFIIGIATSLSALPSADFKLSTKQGCVPLTVNYTDISTGSPVKFEWDFGNGNKSTLQNPSAIYYKSGNFIVSLTVWDNNGNKSVKTFSPVRVFKNPVAKFTADTVGCVGDIINFRDLSTKADTSIVKWTWDYGDGSLTNAQNSTHAYTYDSRFTIGLTVVDGFGCKSLETKIKYIRIKAKPQLAFDLNTNFSCTTPANFNALNKSASTSGYNWTCSNGSSATTKDFFFTINNFGLYDVTLSSTANGCSASLTKKVNVQKLKADFSIPFGGACENSAIKLKNLSSPDMPKNTYLWEWGDGATDTAKNATHTYNSDGTFNIKLTVTNGTCTDAVTKSIFIKKKPAVTVTYDTFSCENPGTINFTLSGSPLSRSIWDWGNDDDDTFSGSKKIISHTFYKQDAYIISYKATDALTGCVVEDTLDHLIHIGGQRVTIVPGDIADCYPRTVDYSLEEDLFQNVKSYEWVFTDDTSVKYHTPEVKRTFTKRGNFNVIVKVVTEQGCVIYDIASISLGDRHIPSFHLLESKHICNGGEIHYINTTKPDSLLQKLKFELKELYPVNPINPTDTVIRLEIRGNDTIVFAKGGMHLLKMTANDNGCIESSTFYDTVWVHGPYPKISLKQVDCKNEFKLVAAGSTWSNRHRLTIDDSLINYSGPFVYQLKRYKKNIIKIKAWNDTFNCVDSAIGTWMSKGPTIHSEINNACAPATAKFSYEEDGGIMEPKWIFPNKDTSLKVKESYTFTEPGKFVVKLTGYIDEKNCPDTSLLIYVIQGAKIRANVIPSGKCLPITLNLIDSSAGTDGNIHTWQVGDDFIQTSSISTKYNIDYVSKGDTGIFVKLMVASSNGCKSEKQYNIPFSGPRVSYTVKRYSICDTPIFYFDAFIADSSNTIFPVKYLWKFSDGTQKKGLKHSGKFKTIGMNYFTLTSTDNVGCQVIFRDSFEVSPNMLQPLFTADPVGRFCPPLQCKFTDLSKTFSADIVKWEWDFGDGTTSQLKNPNKLYLLPGKYDLKLTVTSANGCKATLFKPGYVIINGPKGTYDFDRGDACLPHKVQFRGIALDSATMEWDCGDGVVQQGNYFTHIYNKRGRYIPAMILSDTLGCKYTLPPIDTIEIFDYPKAELKVEGLCFHEPILVGSRSYSNHDDPAMKITWLLNNKISSPGKDSIFKPEGRGNQTIELKVENMGKCRDSASVIIRVFAPTADFSPSKPLICLGNSLTFNNSTISDTTVKSFEWDFDDNHYSLLKNPKHTYSLPGQYDVQLIATDVLDCVDTIRKPASAVVGDTLPPQFLPIRRASVVNNRSVELVYAKYPTFDFTKYIIYREANGKYNVMAEVTDPDDTIFMDNQCRTLDESYCYKITTQNLCLLYSPLAASSEHCTIETKANGLLDVNKVKWTPYIGFDSIEFYEVWREDYSTPTGYRYLDKVEGHTLAYSDTLISCNTRQNYKIIAKQYMGFMEYSKSDTATAKPLSINTTKPNLAWRATVENDDFARVEWLNNAWSKNGMKAYLLSKKLPNGQTLFENKYFNLTDTFYDDQNTKVNEHSYIYTVKGLDLCDDTTPLSNLAQSILLKCYFDDAKQKPALIWNHYNQWGQGIAHYEVEQKMPDGSFVQIGKVSATDSQFIHIDAQQNCTPFFIYRVRAISNSNKVMNRSTFSLSNEADAFPHSTLFIPNAFSPDKNNLNEAFGPQGQYISKYKFQIYNRWGEKIFETNNCMEAWNGFFKEERCEQDVYLYHIEAMGADKKTYNLKGTFHLFR